MNLASITGDTMAGTVEDLVQQNTILQLLSMRSIQYWLMMRGHRWLYLVRHPKVMTTSFGELKPRIERVVAAQREYVNKCLVEAKTISCDAGKQTTKRP